MASLLQVSNGGKIFGKFVSAFCASKSKGLLVASFFVACSVGYTTAVESMTSFYEDINPQVNFTNAVNAVVNSLFLPSAMIVAGLRGGRISYCYLAIILCFTGWITNSLYYGYFESPLPLAVASRVGEVSRVGSHIILGLVSWREFVLVLLGFGTLAIFRKLELANRIQGSQALAEKRSPLIVVCVALVVLLSIKGVLFANRYPPVDLASVNAVESVKKNGFLIYYASQLYSHFFPGTPEPFPGKVLTVAGSSELPVGSSEKLKNVIFIQVESLDAKALDVFAGDKPLMPNLCRIRDASIYCENFFAHHRAGASQDSELSLLYSILPSNRRPGFSNLNTSELTSVCDALKLEGYYLAGFHANSGDFFNRKSLFLRAGFDEFVDEEGFSGDAKGWYSKDVDFVSQAFKKMLKLPSPFCGYLITMQSHGPFRNYTDLSGGVNLEGFPVSAHPYLRSMSEVDTALGYFMELLLDSELGKDTIVFIFGDHSSKVVYEPETYAHLAANPDEHVPLFVIYPGAVPRRIRKACSQIDVAPTLCELLGLKGSPMWLGSSILDGGYGKVILNYPEPRVVENVDRGIRFRNATSNELKIVKWSESLQRN